MVVLKKIKASSLIETMVATVIIVVIFIVASMILNNVFSNTINNNTRAIEAHLNEISYLYLNQELELPYIDTFGNWEIRTEQFIDKGHRVIEFEATSIVAKKKIIKQYFETE